MGKTVWILICVIVCCVCDGKKKTKVIQEGQKAAIIIDRVWDEKVDMKQLDTVVFHLAEDKQAILANFGATRLIPLETKSESLIGNIEKIVC